MRTQPVADTFETELSVSLRMTRAICTLLLLLSMYPAYGQGAGNAPCSSPESHQLDFWLGSWDCIYSDTVHASNVVTKEQGNCVIHEHFSDPSKRYTGESWSVYNPQRRLWQQTWVDNGGGYISLSGSFTDSAMILSTPPRPDGKGNTIRSRMVYQHITANSFDWSWEATTDDGRTWTPNWFIHYKRKT